MKVRDQQIKLMTFEEVDAVWLFQTLGKRGLSLKLQIP